MMGLPGLLCREMPRKVREEPGHLPSHCNQLLSTLEAGELQTVPPTPRPRVVQEKPGVS